MAQEIEIVLLGWWAREQHRIDFVKLIQHELGHGLGDAKRILDDSVSQGFVTLVVPADRALAMATEIAKLGAECRMITAEDAEGAGQQRADLRDAFDTVMATKFDSPEARAMAAGAIAPELSVSSIRSSGFPGVTG